MAKAKVRAYGMSGWVRVAVSDPTERPGERGEDAVVGAWWWSVGGVGVAGADPDVAGMPGRPLA